MLISYLIVFGSGIILLHIAYYIFLYSILYLL
jgi:hypothetical protein